MNFSGLLPFQAAFQNRFKNNHFTAVVANFSTPLVFGALFQVIRWNFTKNISVIDKNSSGDEIANVNFYAARLESYQIR